jgi:5'-3' exoribonuclease 2
MTASRSFFTTYKRLTDVVPIETADGQYSPAIARGNGYVTAMGQRQLLHDVCHVPGLCSNLVSVPQLADRGFSVTFSATEAPIKHSGTTVGRAIRHGATYNLVAMGIGTALVARPGPSPTESILWHRRFGHAGRGMLDRLRVATTGLPAAARPCVTHMCDTCLRSKQPSTFRRHIDHPATRLLEQVHSDFRRPASPAGIHGERYILTFTDEFSRKLWVFATRNPIELRALFRQWKAAAE